MKNRILFISLAVIAVAAIVVAIILGLAGRGGGGGGGEEIPPEPESLVIGTARDTDEGLAIFEGLAAGPVMREFVEYVNDDLGGVHLSAYDDVSGDCYVPLEIDRREISVATWDIGDVTAEICDDIAAGTVHFLWGGPGTDPIYTQAPIANAANVVLLTFEGGATGISNDPNKLAVWPYVFITLSYSDWYQLPVLAKMFEAELGVVDGEVRAYVVHIHGEHGDEYLATAEDNFDIVGHAEIPYDAAEYGPLVDGVMDAAIAALDSTPYDIFCCFAYPDHVMMTTGTAMAKDFNPPAMVCGPGANFGFYAYSFPTEAPDPAMIEGITGFTVAAYAAKPEITAVYDRIAERIDDDEGDPDSGMPGLPGLLSLDYWGIPPYWAGLEMWLEAIEDVGYVDQKLIRDTMAAFEDDPVDTILGDCWFRMYGTPGYGGGNLDYLCHTGEIGQWQSGVFETVGYAGITADLPNYITTADFIFPMTDQWEWLP